MAFWDNVKKYTQPYGDDDYDDYDEDEEYDEEYDEPAEPRRRSRRHAPAREEYEASYAEEEEDDEDLTSTAGSSMPSLGSTAPAPAAPLSFAGRVMPSAESSKATVVIFRPNSFSDVSKAANELRQAHAVVVNMEGASEALARRIVDFMSGVIYALDGSIKKIAANIYLFCPHNVDIQENLEDLESEVEKYI